MKKSVIVLGAALALAACNSQPYPQTAQRACDPQTQDCYGYGAGRDSHGDAIVAGVLGAGVGYVAGRMHNNGGGYGGGYHDDGYHHGYGYHNGYGYHPAPRTVIVHNHYHGTAPSSFGSAPVTPTRTAPITASSSGRTMFGSARRR